MLKFSTLGIPSNFLRWLKPLTGRMQLTFAFRNRSTRSRVTSGVLWGACQTPLLFLIDIKDLSCYINTKLRLLADDCVIPNPTHSSTDTSPLQRIFSTISLWCYKAQMPLNLAKCKVISFSPKHNIIEHSYSITSIPVDRNAP